MLTEQKKLLADVRAAEKTARKLWDAGVKISNVFQKLRATGDELESRVRYLEKEARPRKPDVNTPAKADLVAEFSKLDAKGLQKTKASIEAALKEAPERVDAKVALEAINEVIAKAKS